MKQIIALLSVFILSKGLVSQTNSDIKSDASKVLEINLCDKLLSESSLDTNIFSRSSAQIISITRGRPGNSGSFVSKDTSVITRKVVNEQCYVISDCFNSSPKVSGNSAYLKEDISPSYSMDIGSGFNRTISQGIILSSAARDLSFLVRTHAFINEANGSISIKGSRTDANAYYIDGMRIIQ